MQDVVVTCITEENVVTLGDNYSQGAWSRVFWFPTPLAAANMLESGLPNGSRESIAVADSQLRPASVSVGEAVGQVKRRSSVATGRSARMPAEFGACFAFSCAAAYWRARTLRQCRHSRGGSIDASIRSEVAERTESARPLPGRWAGGVERLQLTGSTRARVHPQPAPGLVAPKDSRSRAGEAALAAPGHGAHADSRDEDAGAAEQPIFHERGSAV
jgi:hypothetical protein